MAQVYVDVGPMAPADAMFDTEDLSTMRGSSAALLWAPDRVKEWLENRVGGGAGQVQTIFTGASEGLFLIDAEDPDEITSGCTPG